MNPIFHIPNKELDSFPEDSFFDHPDGHRYLLIRSVVHNGWLTWADVLPSDRSLWSELDLITASRIKAVATKILEFASLLPDFQKHSAEKPWKVANWWDPSDDGEHFSGSTVFLRHNQFSCHELLDLIPEKSDGKKKKFLEKVCITPAEKSDHFFSITTEPSEPYTLRISERGQINFNFQELISHASDPACSHTAEHSTGHRGDEHPRSAAVHPLRSGGVSLSGQRRAS